MKPTNEQMELAAKAAGISITFMDHGASMGAIAYRKLKFSTGPEWNPLKHGDDSQRLQVRLGMTVSVGPTTVDACCWSDKEKPIRVITKALLFDPAIEGDDLRAMREAIFLVAVEIVGTK